MKTKLIHAGLFGLAVGDALGVPVEFKHRDILKQDPVTDMLEFGTHHQPKGTWSDDSSLAFCLADSLSRGYDLQDLADRFVMWRNAELWTPHGKVFDIGISTNQAIHALEDGVSPMLAGGIKETDNGNGALMRILPLLFYIKDLPIEKRFDKVREVSSLTHSHIRSALACFIYLEFGLAIINGKDKFEAYQDMQNSVLDFLNTNAICSQKEIEKFHRILEITVEPYELQRLLELEEVEISSSGYVLHSLEASLWCVLTSNSYKETVLKAVNLGSDTDTTAAIAGGISGMIYGLDEIPQSWLDCLARRNAINDLCDRFEENISEIK
jgi:ADP-ribosylglycohydrolase